MRIKSHKLTQFKGKSLELNANGQDVAVYGDNATGKTTLADAYAWLLFGKNSQGKSDFEIKTIDPETGEVRHRLNHEVETTFEVGDKEIALKKSYREIWEKTRGSQPQTFSGHTTDYYVNGVPVLKKEFDLEVARICAPAHFRLLSDPYHFNMGMTWQERRALLIDQFGDITDEEVITFHASLSELPALLTGRTAENQKKVLISQRRELNERLVTIPIRIDEASRSIVADLNPVDIAGIEVALCAANERLASAQNGGVISARLAKIRTIESSLFTRELELKKAASSEYDAAAHAVRVATTAYNQGLEKADVLSAKVNMKALWIANQKSEVSVHVTNYNAMVAQSFSWHDGAQVCKLCRQPLPTADVEALRTAAMAAFNEFKSKQLSLALAKGKTDRALLEQVQADLADLEVRLETTKAELADLASVLENANLCASDVDWAIVDFATDETWAHLTAEVVAINASIDDQVILETEARAVAQAEVGMLESLLTEAKEVSAQLAESERAKARIVELETEEKFLAEEFEKANKTLYLIEEFTRLKCAMLSKRINSQFCLVEFRLFENQINGGVADCCECIVDGVPFASLNHGSQLNAGLDIIETFARHLKFAPPIFIDNAESVTQIVPTTGQQIRLIVSAQDKTLRVELTPSAQDAVTPS